MRFVTLLCMTALSGADASEQHPDECVDERCRNAGIGFAKDMVETQLVACARGTLVGGLATSFARGCTLSRTATGVLTATLDPAPAPQGGTDAATDSLLFCQPLTNNINVTPVDTSATVKTFNFFAGGGTTATDSGFEIEIYRLITR